MHNPGNSRPTVVLHVILSITVRWRHVVQLRYLMPGVLVNVVRLTARHFVTGRAIRAERLMRQKMGCAVEVREENEKTSNDLRCCCPIFRHARRDQ
jgi:hypothetical protein